MQRSFRPTNQGSRFFAVTTDPRRGSFIVEIDHIEAVSGKHIRVRCCSCSRMAANLWEHPRITILVWDAQYNLSLQLSGRFLHMRSTPLTCGDTSETDAILESHSEMDLMIEIDGIEEIERAVHGEETVIPARWPMHHNQHILQG
ncbi:MAG: hypothetical protein ACMUIL_11860 [bacterium]